MENEFIYELLKKQYDEESITKILNGFSKKRKTTLRVNTLKSSIEEISNILKENDYEVQISNKVENAVILLNKDENDIKKLSIYDDGKIYLQSISSMVPPVILGAKENENILDMAAAPGSKTTQMYNMAFRKVLYNGL